jgi:hypothetical protein
MVMDGTRAIYGSYGELWQDGTWLTNINKVQASGEINKEEVQRSGTRITAHKTTSVTFSGTMSGLKISSALVKQIGQVGTDRGVPFVTELIAKLDDPESWGAERIRMKGVQFDKIDLVNFEANKLVETEIPFTFSGFDLLDEIKES